MSNNPHIELDYHYITDGIYIGTNQCCQTHFDEHLLKAHGITVDISLEGERLDAPFGVEWYVWIPVEDKTSPTQGKLVFGVEVLKKSVELGRKIYVHCKNGHGRAPTLVAAYLIAVQGKSVKEVVEFIRSQRPSIHLEENQQDVLKIFLSNLRYFTCGECGMQYKEKEWRDQCEKWCKEHQSCNIEIIEHAVQREEE